MQNSGKKKKTTLGTKDKNERMEGRSRKVLQNGTNRTGNLDKKNLAAGKDKKKNKIQN